MHIPRNTGVTREMVEQALDGWRAAWADGVFDPHERAMHEAMLVDLRAQAAATDDLEALSLAFHRPVSEKRVNVLVAAARAAIAEMPDRAA